MRLINYKQDGELLTMGIMFPVCIAIGYGLGGLFDNWVGSENLFKILGIFFGISAAFLNLFRVAKRFSDDNQKTTP